MATAAPAAPPSAAMRRNARGYPWYVFLFNAFFWMPVFFLYFGEHLPLGQILVLEGIYYAAVVAMELPSGYFSDRVGRRPTLVVSSTALFLAYSAFFVGDNFAMLAVGQVLLAAGISFNSGTDTSFHYDSLVAAGLGEEYEAREAIAARNGLGAMGLAALLGGAAATVELRLAYGLSALAAVGSLLVTLSFTEPPRFDGNAAPFVRQLRNCVAHLRSPTLGWLFGFAVLAVVLEHVPYEFYQPYIDALRAGRESSSAWAAGLHMAVATFIAAWAAGRSASIAARLGIVKVLILAAALQVVLIATMGAVLHAVVLIVVVLRDVPGALVRAPLNAAVTPRVPQHERATYLSMQSLAGRLAFSGLLVVLSVVAGDADGGQWPTLSALLLWSAAIGATGLAVIVTTRRRARL